MRVTTFHSHLKHELRPTSLLLVVHSVTLALHLTHSHSAPQTLPIPKPAVTFASSSVHNRRQLNKMQGIGSQYGVSAAE